MTGQTASHAALMNETYRYQRYFYDATRRFYLLGRDQLIADLNPAPNARVLEIACGTGRNLARINRVYPGRALYGLDISEEMLRSARAKLDGHANLQAGDACHFDAQALFGPRSFDRIVMSYCLSMIPDWQGAVRNGLRHLKPGGSLHIVDFGDQSGLPSTFERGLTAWLGKFHVTIRRDLVPLVSERAARTGDEVDSRALFRGYAQQVTVRRPTRN
ncbi:class I SAM-dependent methyltransferase [Tropicimonas sp. S265A]|uniref:class I SAM-dependent methyltransferase n=1 Tax=Tropicimonas sp. S265A TaxID=3415134 RepID=UPI003C7E7342